MERTQELPFRGLPRELRDMIWRYALAVDHVHFRKLSVSEKPDVGCLGIPHLHSPLSRLNDTRCDPLHLRLFLTNKQMYAETSRVFYSSNEFTTDVMSLTHSKFNANIRRNVRRVRLETRPWQAIVQRYTPPLRDIHLSFTSHRIELLTITMPAEPSAFSVLVKGENLAITPSLAVDLVDCMLRGYVKRIRLVYPTPTDLVHPRQFQTIKVMRRGKAAVTGDLGRILDTAWWNADRRSYAEVLYNLRDVPKKFFMTRFEDSHCYLRLPPRNAVVLLSRYKDEPIEKHTVPRPRVCIVSLNTHLKRRLPWNPNSFDPRPDKIPRLKLPTFLAFSESRSRNMPQSAVQERFKGRSNEIRRLVNDRGPPLVRITREAYRWQQQSIFGISITFVPCCTQRRLNREHNRRPNFQNCSISASLQNSLRA